jgi:hypothetical protein
MQKELSDYKTKGNYLNYKGIKPFIQKKVLVLYLLFFMATGNNF